MTDTLSYQHERFEGCPICGAPIMTEKFKQYTMSGDLVVRGVRYKCTKCLWMREEGS